MPKKYVNPTDRMPSEPKRQRDGWLVNINDDNHFVEGQKGRVRPTALFMEGHLHGVWLYDAGVNGDGQHSFKLFGHPDFLDEVADALKSMANDIREKAGWVER